MNLIGCLPAIWRGAICLFIQCSGVRKSREIVPVSEEMATLPINPYGRTKLITEWNLRDVCSEQPIVIRRGVSMHRFALLQRCGCPVDGTLGQATPEATHLIKVACETALGKRDSLAIFGTDYDTPDGTCIRDYIHVEDLATAHLDALQYLCRRWPIGNTELRLRPRIQCPRSVGDGPIRKWRRFPNHRGPKTSRRFASIDCRQSANSQGARLATST